MYAFLIATVPFAERNEGNEGRATRFFFGAFAYYMQVALGFESVMQYILTEREPMQIRGHSKEGVAPHSREGTRQTG